MSFHPVASHCESVLTLDVVGTSVRILLDGKQTHGAFALVEMIGQPGDSVPPHVHTREEETFHVLEGELEVWCGGHTTILRTGDTFFAPRNIPHSPKFIGNGAGRVLVTLTPAGFERSFRDLDAEASTAPVTPEKASEIVNRYGCSFVTP